MMFAAFNLLKPTKGTDHADSDNEEDHSDSETADDNVSRDENVRELISIEGCQTQTAQTNPAIPGFLLRAQRRTFDNKEEELRS